MIATWVDASAPLSGAALRQNNIVGCMRYVGIGSSGKRLTVTERDDLLGAGRIVLGIAESTATEADNGAPAGQRDAEAVLADPAAAGLPYIFMTNDKPGYISADIDYAAAYAEVLGIRASDYGFASFLLAVRAAGISMSLHWQAGYPPNLTGTQGWVHFWQRQGTPGNGSDGPATPTTAVIGGVTVDLNNQLLEVPMSLDPSNPNDATVIAGAQSCLPGIENVHPAGELFLVAYNTQQAVNQALTQLGALSGALSADEAAILAAIKAQPTGGQVDVTALATSLAPTLAKLLPQSTPAEVGAAVEQALAAQFAK